MAETITKLPVKTEQKGTAATVRAWGPFDGLRREIDQLFNEFDGGAWRWPFRRSFFISNRSDGAKRLSPRYRLSMSRRPTRLMKSPPNCPA